MKEYKLSPMMEHYLAVKKEHPDALLFYRLGDFYEMFFEDAQEASRLLDLTLTGRECGLENRAPMCGVPHHAADGYIAKLIKLGKKVAVCEQLSAPGDQKGMVKRGVIRVITPGTVTEEEMLDGGANNYLMAAYAEKDGGALVWLDNSTGELSAMEFDAKSLTRLEDSVLSVLPAELIANAAAAEMLKRFESVRQGKLPKPYVYYEYAFAKDNAEKTAVRFYQVHRIDALGLEAHPHILCALGGILRYLEDTQKRTLSHIRPPRIVHDDNRMFLDYATKKNLELTETLADKKVKGSLLGVLDMTRTNMGTRLLRKWITEPLTKPADIAYRLDATDELFKKADMRTRLSGLLSEMRDMERLASRIAYGSITPREMTAVAQTLKQIAPLKSALKGVKSGYLQAICETLDPLNAVQDVLAKALAENPPISLKNGGVIRTGYHAELDRLRSLRASGKNWLMQYEAKEKEETGLKTLKIGFNKVFGYYIEVSKSYVSQVPYRYERKQTLTTGERYITRELKEMEEEMLGAEEKAQAIEEALYAALKDGLQEVLSTITKNAVAAAELDVLVSYATVAAANGYVRPAISPKIKHIHIKEGRHPVVESVSREHPFVPNDTLLDADGKLLVVTGPNMAGKSTFMRQTALIVLMAHIGSFVPAVSAEISVVDRIFTRIGASDNLAYGQSTFMVEMTEVAGILNHATENSLLILDEIGRGTSTMDGLSIAWSLVEHLALRVRAKTLFATHYHELSALEPLIPHLKNYHVLIKENKDGIVFLYKIARGSASKSFGIEVASIAGVEKRVIERAKEIMASLEENERQNGGRGAGVASSQSVAEAVPAGQFGFFEEDPVTTEIFRVLKDTDPNSCTPIQAITILADLKARAEQKK